MGLPSTTFSSPFAGQLRVFLSGRYGRGVGDSGFPSALDGDIRVRAFAGVAGSYSYTSPVDKYTQSAFIDLAYPGSGVVWNLGTEVYASSPPSGTTYVYIRDLRLAWELVKL